MLTKTNKTIYLNLISIYGIGTKKAQDICEKLGVSKNTLINDIPTNKKDALNAILINLKKTGLGIDNELKNNITTNVLRLINNFSYRGKRHKLSLPTRGQRTRTNAKTVKRIKQINLT